MTNLSKYTTEVRYICEYYVGLEESAGLLSVNDIIDKAMSSVFDFSYPIFNENYRAELQRKILKHFYTREIGEETVGLWKLRLDTKLNEIMPYYNKLYESELIEFDPLYDTNITTTHTGTKKDDKNGSSKTTEKTQQNVNGVKDVLKMFI